MNNNYEAFRAKVFSAMRGLANDCPEFSDAEMLMAASDVNATLKRSTVHKNIDVEWVDKIEETLPYLDLIVRNPTIMIEDVDEILPVELSRNITEKTIKHLAQHTNMILTITEKDEVIPQKLLNVYHEETLLTYENKFINTLLARLSAFVDKRYKLLRGGFGIERNYQFRYSTEFEHVPFEDAGKNHAQIKLSIDLASPVSVGLTEEEQEANERYLLTLARVEKIHNAITSYMSSSFVRSLGRNYIRPPVIRTNAILKNKNMRVCLNLWEYIESFDKAGYSVVNDEFTEVPSDNYITDLYSSVALQYTDFYNGVAENAEETRILANRRLSNVEPDFSSDFEIEEIDDYKVYDSEYKKTVPVSRLMNNRKKLSEDEKRVRLAIQVALKADELMFAEELAREAEERRMAREKRLAEEEARRLAEAEAKRIAEEEARRFAEEEEAKRLAEEEARRIAAEEAELQEKELDALVDSIINEEETDFTLVRAGGKPRVLRKIVTEEEKQGFAYADFEDAGDTGIILIPYTRAQYLALPRKKKKTVLMYVKTMQSYRNTSAMIEVLKSKTYISDRTAEKIRMLETKMNEQAKALPKAQLWEASVQRLKK